MPFRLDETDPELLVLYTGGDDPTIAAYQAFYAHWAKRLQAGERFATVIVYEPRTQQGAGHEAGHKRDGDWENAYSRLITDFRNANRDANGELGLGFARVLSSPRARGFFEDPKRAAKMKARIDRYARYMYGVPGGAFPDLEGAKSWLKGLQHGAATVVRHDLESAGAEATGLYYGSTTGMTEYVAEKLAAAWTAAGLGALEPVNISYLEDLSAMLAHDRLILGIPTWNIGQLQDDWASRWAELESADFSGKQVAIFGVGDQINYAENFIDAVGLLAALLRERGATLIGSWPTESYTFEASLAQEGDSFCGLGIDEYNQENLTDGRISAWLEQVQREFAEAEGVLESV